MKNAKIYLLIFLLGASIGAGLCGWFAYRPSASRASDLGGQLADANDAYQRLADNLAQRETLVSELREAIDERQGILDRISSEAESSKGSIAKIRAILEIIKAHQLHSNPSGGS
jgi:hypothetical protein